MSIENSRSRSSSITGKGSVKSEKSSFFLTNLKDLKENSTIEGKICIFK